MKNVLFIVYYFPPMGGSGVQRPLKFIKYLREFGWNPIILCPEPGAYHTFDQSLQDELESLNVEVHRVDAKTPFHRVGQNPREVKVPDNMAKIMRWFSMFFFLPDNKKNWIEPGFQKGLELIKTTNIHAIFSSAPPYSNLILTQRLKQKTAIPVIMDLRDDWVGSHLINYPTAWHKMKMEQVEKKTLKSADILITINKEIANSIKSRISNKVEVIGHGFDPKDFSRPPHADVKPNGKVSFLYSGTFYLDSSPQTFLKAVNNLIRMKPDMKDKLELQFQGGLSSNHWKLIEKLGLASIVKDFGYVDHTLAVKNLMNADVLWLIVGQKKNSEIISLGKTSEYFATRKPILGLVPEGSAKEMLLSYGKSYIADPHNISEITERLRHIIEDSKKDKWPLHSEEIVESYNRKKLTGKLADLLNKISL